MASLAYMNGRRKYNRPQGMLLANNPGTIISVTDPETQVISNFYVPLGTEVGSQAYINDLSDGVIDGGNVLLPDSNEFLILSDDNRKEINFKQDRIEKRERMINGRMRSYHIADKLTIDTGWDMLPSRSTSKPPLFSASGQILDSYLAIEGYNSGMLDATINYEAVIGADTIITKPQVTVLNADGKLVNIKSKEVTIPGQRLGVEKTIEVQDPDGRATSTNSQLYTTDGGAGGAELLDWYERYTGSFWLFLAYDKYPNFGKAENAYTNLQKYNQVVEVFFSDFSYSVVKRGGSNYDFWNVSFSLEEV